MSTTPDADDVSQNELWLATMHALRCIATDPRESRQRRRKAQDAINAAVMPSGSAGSTLGNWQAGDGIRHTRNGGLLDHDDMAYDGTGDGR